MAVEPHTPARRSTTSAASRMPPPPPPTSGLAVRPRTPASPRAVIAGRGNEPCSSVVAARGATTSVMTGSSASRWVLNGGLLSVSSTAATRRLHQPPPTLGGFTSLPRPSGASPASPDARGLHQPPPTLGGFTSLPRPSGASPASPDARGLHQPPP